jgi:hypothetical protein
MPSCSWCPFRWLAENGHEKRPHYPPLRHILPRVLDPMQWVEPWRRAGRRGVGRQPACATSRRWARRQHERRCRYITRPAVSQARLRRRSAGRIELTLESIWRNGTHAPATDGLPSHAAARWRLVGSGSRWVCRASCVGVRPRRWLSARVAAPSARGQPMSRPLLGAVPVRHDDREGPRRSISANPGPSRCRCTLTPCRCTRFIWRSPGFSGR